jgi:hypothetical protein
MTLELVPPDEGEEDHPGPMMTPVIIIEPEPEMIEQPTEQGSSSLAMAMMRRMDRLQVTSDHAVRLLEQLIAERADDRRGFNELEADLDG